MMAPRLTLQELKRQVKETWPEAKNLADAKREELAARRLGQSGARSAARRGFEGIARAHRRPGQSGEMLLSKSD